MEAVKHIKLGIFVATGTLLLITTLYLIGSKRSVFSSTITIKALFHNVNGLLAGNSVRYAGIDIGTVDKIIIDNDSTVHVYMLIEKKAKKFIKKNAIASIGTEGLMGNKLVTISAAREAALPIEEGDELLSSRGVDSEDMIRTLSITNDNIAAITHDLKIFTSKMNSENGLINIFSDPKTAQNIREAFSVFKEVAENTRNATNTLNVMLSDLKTGKGIVSTLVYDTNAATNLKNSIRNLEHISDSLNIAARQLHTFASSLNNPNGAIHTLTSDTAISRDLKTTISNLKVSSELLNEDLKALQSSFLFRKYFRQKESQMEREKQKQKKNN